MCAAWQAARAPPRVCFIPQVHSLVTADGAAMLWSSMLVAWHICTRSPSRVQPAFCRLVPSLAGGAAQGATWSWLAPPRATCSTCSLGTRTGAQQTAAGEPRYRCMRCRSLDSCAACVLSQSERAVEGRPPVRGMPASLKLSAGRISAGHSSAGRSACSARAAHT